MQCIVTCEVVIRMHNISCLMFIKKIRKDIENQRTIEQIICSDIKDTKCCQDDICAGAINNEELKMKNQYDFE